MNTILCKTFKLKVKASDNMILNKPDSHSKSIDVFVQLIK